MTVTVGGDTFQSAVGTPWNIPEGVAKFVQPGSGGTVLDYDATRQSYMAMYGVDPLGQITPNANATPGSAAYELSRTYYSNNPSQQFQELTAQYAQQHGSIVGSSGTLTPSQQATFQPYNTPATEAMVASKAALLGAQYGAGLISSPEVQSGINTLARQYSYASQYLGNIASSAQNYVKSYLEDSTNVQSASTGTSGGAGYTASLIGASGEKIPIQSAAAAALKSSLMGGTDSDTYTISGPFGTTKEISNAKLRVDPLTGEVGVYTKNNLSQWTLSGGIGRYGAQSGEYTITSERTGKSVNLEQISPLWTENLGKSTALGASIPWSLGSGATGLATINERGQSTAFNIGNYSNVVPSTAILTGGSRLSSSTLAANPETYTVVGPFGTTKEIDNSKVIVNPVSGEVSIYTKNSLGQWVQSAGIGMYGSQSGEYTIINEQTGQKVNLDSLVGKQTLSESQIKGLSSVVSPWSVPSYTSGLSEISSSGSLVGVGSVPASESVKSIVTYPTTQVAAVGPTTVVKPSGNILTDIASGLGEWGTSVVKSALVPGEMIASGLASVIPKSESVTPAVGGAPIVTGAAKTETSPIPTTIADTGISSTFADVSNLFRTTPVLNIAYNIGSEVKSGNVPLLSLAYKTGTETKLSSDDYFGSILSGVIGGGKATEAYYDYQKVASVNTEKINALSPDYETDLAKYNKNLEAYNANPTQAGYDSLVEQQKNLDVKYSKISSLQNQIDSAKSYYAKSVSPLTGGVDQSKLVTYGVGSAIGDVGKWYSENIETPINTAVSGWGIPGQFISGVAELPQQVTTVGQSLLEGGETILRNPSTFVGLATAGLAMQIGGMYQSATTNPAKFAGEMAGQYLLFKGGEKLYNAQPYRIGLQKAEIVSSSGMEPTTAKFTSAAITKLSGAEKQIEQLSSSLFGVGGKTPKPTDVILGSKLLEETPSAAFTTKTSTFASAKNAMADYLNIAKLGEQKFYHVTPENAFVNTLLTKGSVAVSGGGREGALFFAEPDTILTQYAGETGAKVALRLETTPKVTTEFLGAVEKLKSGGVGAYGRNFAEVVSNLPSGILYPGLRAAAGKSWKGIGLEEEYVLTPDTTLYLKGAENVIGPKGEKWAILDVSLDKPLVPNLKYGIVRAASYLKNVRPYVGVPKPTKEMFTFGSKESTYAAESPLEVAMVKKYVAPEEAQKINYYYKAHEIGTGSGIKNEMASTAIGEVIKSRNLPNPTEVTNAILQVSIDYGAKLYGSSGQKAAGIESGVTTLIREVNDLDVMIPEAAGQPGKVPFLENLKTKAEVVIGKTKDISHEPMGLSYAEDVVSAINKAAKKEVVYVDKEGTVQMSDGSGKLFDIHNENPTINELLKQGTSSFRSPSGYFGLGMKPQKYVTTSEGLELMSYAEQTGRKGSGSMGGITWEPKTITSKEYEGGPEVFSVTGKITPSFEGRMKDIGDAYIGEKGNIELMSRSSNPVVRAKAAKMDVYLEKWLDTWGAEAAEKVRANYTGGKIVIDLSKSGAVKQPSTAQTSAGKYLFGGAAQVGISPLPKSVYGKKQIQSTSIFGTDFESPSAVSRLLSKGVEDSISGSANLISTQSKRIVYSVLSIKASESVDVSESVESSLDSVASLLSASTKSLLSIGSESPSSASGLKSTSISGYQSDFSDLVSQPSDSISIPSVPSSPSIPVSPSKTSPPSKPSPPYSPLLFLSGSTIPPGGGGGGHKKKFKRHKQVFSYPFTPGLASQAMMKALKQGSNYTKGQLGSSLPNSGFLGIKPAAQKAQPKLVVPKIAASRVAQKTAVPKINIPTVKATSTRVNLPKINIGGMKSISLPSSLPQKKKKK